MDGGRRLTLEHFRAFVAVVDSGGFAGATERLMRTQSALTRQIQGLEDILGERLLTRTRGHFGGPTEAGNRFLPRARRVLGAVESAYLGTGRADLAGRLRIGAMDDFDIRWLIDLIGRFEARHPGVEVSTVLDLSSRLDERLARGEIDVAITKRLFDPSVSNSDDALRIERLHWVSGVDARWTVVDRLPLVVFHEGCVYRKRLLDALNRAGLAWRIAYVGQGYASIRDAVAAGFGITALPDRLVAAGHVIHRGRDAGIDLPDLGHIELLTRAAGDRNDPAVAAFRLDVERGLRAGGDPWRPAAET